MKARTVLHEFITENRMEIIARCRARIASRPAPRATDAELEHGVPLFLDQLADTLQLAMGVSNPDIGMSAAKHGKELLRRGFTIAQVVHDYGGICQTITEMASEKRRRLPRMSSARSTCASTTPSPKPSQNMGSCAHTRELNDWVTSRTSYATC
jgi:hypothetical protein